MKNEEKKTNPSSRDRTSDIKITAYVSKQVMVTSYSLALFQLSYRRHIIRLHNMQYIQEISGLVLSYPRSVCFLVSSVAPLALKSCSKPLIRIASRSVSIEPVLVLVNWFLSCAITGAPRRLSS